MARSTARIQRLEALDGARTGAELAHLSEDELKARICRSAKQVTTQLRDSGTSIVDWAVELGCPIDDRYAAALNIELAAPAFDATRFLAALNGQPAGPAADAPDMPP